MFDQSFTALCFVSVGSGGTPLPGQPGPFPADQRIALLRCHRLEKKTISDLCKEHRYSIALCYSWQK
jgi:hypothetical protein